MLYASPTTSETDSASGLNLELSAPQFLGFANSPSEIKSATVTLPPGFTINPDAADGQTACSDELANFDSEGPAECPDSSKIGTFAIGTQALPGTLDGVGLHRRTKARKPVPALPRRLRLRDQREAGRIGQAGPRHRAADGLLRRPPPGARSTISSSTSSPPTAA